MASGAWSAAPTGTCAVSGLNFEINLEVYQASIVEQVSTKIAANQTTRLLQVDLDRRSLPGRLRDNAAHLMLPYL